MSPSHSPSLLMLVVSLRFHIPCWKRYTFRVHLSSKIYSSPSRCTLDHMSFHSSTWNLTHDLIGSNGIVPDSFSNAAVNVIETIETSQDRYNLLYLIVFFPERYLQRISYGGYCTHLLLRLRLANRHSPDRDLWIGECYSWICVNCVRGFHTARCVVPATVSQEISDALTCLWIHSI